MLGLERGSPFVLDARVQWIALCRGKISAPAKGPQTIHLLGDRDDIVSKDDGMDLIAAKNTIFVTLQDTGHWEIGSALGGGVAKADQVRREKVQLALRGELDLLDPDKTAMLEEDSSVERIVYVMHGIRDYGEWTDRQGWMFLDSKELVQSAIDELLETGWLREIPRPKQPEGGRPFSPPFQIFPSAREILRRS